MVKAFSSCLNETTVISVRKSFLSNIICFVQVAVEASMVESDVKIKNVAILKRPLVRYAVADDFVRRRTNGLGEVDVVERGGVGLSG